ncbi:MAG TPA: response regulator [Candidatus Angelobacter sp.]|nr:response regulator [Candidatus Angelobacter sp.]
MEELYPILIAEDDENDTIILERVLRRVGFRNPFQFCRDGTEVISYLRGEGRYEDRSSFPFPRILITDLKMPKMSGLEVLKWLHEHPKCNVIPKIVLTASRHETDIQEAYKWGVNSYLVKPGGYERLTQIMKVFFDYWDLCEKPQLPSKC